MKRKNIYVVATMVAALVLGMTSLAAAVEQGDTYGDAQFGVTVEPYAESLEVTFYNWNQTVKEGDTDVEYVVRLENTTDFATEHNVRMEVDFDHSEADSVEPENFEYCLDTVVEPGGGRGDPSNVNCEGSWVSFSGDSFGPATGFEVPAGYDATTLVRADFPDAGQVGGTIKAVAVGTP